MAMGAGVFVLLYGPISTAEGYRMQCTGWISHAAVQGALTLQVVGFESW